MIDVKSSKSSLRFDIIKAFGADFDLEIRDSLFFVSETTNAIIYPVGHHIAIRNLFVRDQMKKSDILFIYNDPDVIKITSMNISRDHNMLLVCEKKEKSACICIYNLSKLNFNNVVIFKPRRKVVTTHFKEFTYASFSWDGNYIACLGITQNGETSSSIIQGVIWDVQIYQAFKDDNYKPKCQFDLPNEVTKISLEPEENKIICTSGNMHMNFWHIYENTVKPFKEIKGLNIETNNFLDHDWVKVEKDMVVTINDKNEIFILEKVLETKKDEQKFNLRIEQIKIRQHIMNCFGGTNHYINSCMVRSFQKGLVIGSSQGHILFVEKVNLTDQLFRPVRYTSRDKIAKVVGISFNFYEEYIAIAFNSNEICTASIVNIFENLKTPHFDLNFDVVCDGFHIGQITSMDVALQRPIIVTSSMYDKTIRVWNYLTGHCEYCKIILTEKEENETELDILSVAIHPNGYYIALSDSEMIRFFHLCYRELRYYNNDSVRNENTKKMCTLLKFSNGGHLLAAVSNKTLYILKSYTRETLREFKTSHTGTIKSIVWDENDYYVYTVGSDGVMIEYNLFNFKVEELATKNITYSGATMFTLDRRNTNSNFSYNAIMACGVFQSKNVISQIVKMDMEKTSDGLDIVAIDQPVHAICQIRSKKFDIFSLACGTENGEVSLMQFPLQKRNFWETSKAHNKQVNSLSFSRDTNLLFSSGADGNLFIYCIYELPDGESIAFDDNKMSNIQLTSIIDEGLGDNVLFPLEKIFKYEEDIRQNSLQIIDLKKKEEEINKAFDKKLIEKEGELNRIKDKELKLVNDQLKEMKTSKDTVTEHYEEKLKKQLNDHHKLIIEKEKQYNDRIESLMNTIHDLHSRIIYLQNEHEVELKKKDDEYEKKITLLEQEMRKKFDELKSINDQLNVELEQRQKMEELKFNHLDEEHEQEISYKQQKYQNSLLELLQENNTLKLSINKKEEESKQKETEIKKHVQKIRGLEETITALEERIDTMKKFSEEKEKEFFILQDKLNIYEKVLQEEKKISGFSSKLKNELYKRNTEIMGHYNKQHNYISDLKTTSQNIGKELEETIRLFQDKEKEVFKQKGLYAEQAKKVAKMERILKAKDMVFDNLLQKIHEAFQDCDKTKILNGLRKVYTEYVNDDVIRGIEESKLNTNIKNELDKQIDFLQNSLNNVYFMKGKKEKIQKDQILITTKQNADLINHLNEIKKQQTNLEKENLKLKSQCSALGKTLENFKRGATRMKNQSPIDDFDNEDRNTFTASEKKRNIEDIIKSEKKESSTVTNDFFKINSLTGFEKRKISKSKGKVYKGSIVQAMKKNDDNIKLNEIMRVIEEKNEIIIKQNLELQRLRKEDKLLSGEMNVHNNSYNKNYNISEFEN